MAVFRACGSSARCEILLCLKIVPSTTCVQKYAHTCADVLLNRMTYWGLQTAVITDFTQHSLRSRNGQDVGHTHSTFVSSTSFERKAVSAGVLCLARHLPLFSPSFWPSDRLLKDGGAGGLGVRKVRLCASRRGDHGAVYGELEVKVRVNILH